MPAPFSRVVSEPPEQPDRSMPVSASAAISIDNVLVIVLPPWFAERVCTPDDDITQCSRQRTKGAGSHISARSFVTMLCRGPKSFFQRVETAHVTITRHPI
jgi:hypothetical protein